MGERLKFVERIGDMHPTRAVRVTTQRSGDKIVSIVQDGWPVGDVDTGSVNDRTGSVEYCSNGGRSSRTVKAIIALEEAIELDNAERPIPKP